MGTVPGLVPGVGRWCMKAAGSPSCPACRLQGLLLSHTLHHNPGREPRSSNYREALQQGNGACGGKVTTWPGTGT